jgi:hypothetical protein
VTKLSCKKKGDDITTLQPSDTRLQVSIEARFGPIHENSDGLQTLEAELEHRSPAVLRKVENC